MGTIKRVDLSKIAYTQADADAGRTDPAVYVSDIYAPAFDNVEADIFDDETVRLYKRDDNGEKIGLGWTTVDAIEMDESQATSTTNENVEAIKNRVKEGVTTILNSSDTSSNEAETLKNNVKEGVATILNSNKESSEEQPTTSTTNENVEAIKNRVKEGVTTILNPSDISSNEAETLKNNVKEGIKTVVGSNEAQSTNSSTASKINESVEAIQSNIKERVSENFTKIKEQLNSNENSNSDSISDSQDLIAANIKKVGDVLIPEEFGNGGYSITMYKNSDNSWNWAQATSQGELYYNLWEPNGQQFDNGIAVIDGRYLIACTESIGQVGDEVDFYLDDGTKIPCIIADIKSSGDAGYNQWGHNNGQNIIEFEVDGEYYRNYGNPGNENWFPEWGGKRVSSFTNLGSIYDMKSADIVEDNSQAVKEKLENIQNNMQDKVTSDLSKISEQLTSNQESNPNTIMDSADLKTADVSDNLTQQTSSPNEIINNISNLNDFKEYEKLDIINDSVAKISILNQIATKYENIINDNYFVQKELSTETGSLVFATKEGEKPRIYTYGTDGIVAITELNTNEPIKEITYQDGTVTATFENDRIQTYRIDENGNLKAFGFYGGRQNYEDATDLQKQIVDTAYNPPADAQTGKDQCLGYVNDVFAEVGVVPKYAWPTATESMWAINDLSTDFSNIPVGAVIVTDRSAGDGVIVNGVNAGHIGIYVGNGMIRENAGGVHNTAIDSWISQWQANGGNVAWGWLGNVDLFNNDNMTTNIDIKKENETTS